MAATDAQSLLAQAKCYLCLGITIGEALQLALLANIVTNGSAGGSVGAGLGGVGSPQGVVTAAPFTTYWDTAGQSLWIKNSGFGNTGWNQITA
jgi:hypothetical protein